MANDYVFPSNAELSVINQDLVPRLTKDRLAFQLFPIKTVDYARVEWDQLDNFTGLQNARGLNGEPTSIKKIGTKRYVVNPGYYGEFDTLNEVDLTERRIPGTWNTPANLDDLVMPINNRLVGRELDRMEKVIWDLATTGTYSVLGPGGVQMATDTFTLQTFTASPLWSSTTTATPLADARAVQLLARGHSVVFDASARIYLNRKTMNTVLNNTNAADIFGKRTSGVRMGGTTTPTNSITTINELQAEDDLPLFQVYDQFYVDDSGVTQMFIPDGKAVLVGRRTTGEPVGNYLLTRNAQNPNSAPGPYSKVIDKGETQGLRVIEIHRGHNGGPALYFGSALVVMNI